MPAQMQLVSVNNNIFRKTQYNIPAKRVAKWTPINVDVNQNQTSDQQAVNYTFKSILISNTEQTQRAPAVMDQTDDANDIRPSMITTAEYFKPQLQPGHMEHKYVLEYNFPEIIKKYAGLPACLSLRVTFRSFEQGLFQRVLANIDVSRVFRYSIIQLARVNNINDDYYLSYANALLVIRGILAGVASSATITFNEVVESVKYETSFRCFIDEQSEIEVMAPLLHTSDNPESLELQYARLEKQRGIGGRDLTSMNGRSVVDMNKLRTK